MSWNMFPNGTPVVFDLSTREGRTMSEAVQKQTGICTRGMVMTIVENKMVPVDPTVSFMGSQITSRSIPFVQIMLPNGNTLEIEPVALSRAS